ncbi:hypothetical protein B0T14DRAFT_35139 [Immersiella caudata]|uniref:NADH-ubiquinone oxidoreductase 17.8 kDa subunit n=1 Tax=Immersiella caudata TaxID=314043 RepID=A0AA39XEK6_9PEZI|nr:hypothetical protein B0T14DRAFT_35139 [Immersiella caudata]
MSALRQRAACVARQTRLTGVRNTRSYASGSHGHHHEHTVEESFGPGFYLAFAAIPVSVFVYQISRPAKDGELTTIGKWLEKAADLSREWEEKNHNTTAAIQQAAKDKHLFYNVQKNPHIELSYPETFQHGSPYNVPAGHYVNLDKVIAHYQKQHLDEEARKAQKLASKAE